VCALTMLESSQAGFANSPFWENPSALRLLLEDGAAAVSIQSGYELWVLYGNYVMPYSAPCWEWEEEKEEKKRIQVDSN
jgi:hypothetical protein